MSKLANQDIELFRAGDYGEKGVYTHADLDQMVSNFQSGNHDAPLVIGHPKTNDPAFGWLASMQRVGDLLVGRAKDVEPTFESMVERGLFKKRSVSLAKGDTGWIVKHVGWLGAKAPEVKGLADCKFETSNAELTEVIFEEDSMAAEDTILARLNAWYEEKFPKTATVAATTFSEADVKRIAGEAVAAAITPLQAKIDAQATTFSERDEKLVTAETKGRADAAVAKLKTAGRWIPAFDKMGLPAVFAELAKTTTVVEFGEGAEKKSATPLDTLVAFMEGLQKIVPNGAIYTGQVAPTARKTAAINDSQRTPADPNSVALLQFAETRAREQKIDYGTALSQVAAEHPELTIPGGAATGAV